jgi:UDP-2-acetamido-2,6-beta-L-arabino-hexul-4-ose reductase
MKRIGITGIEGLIGWHLHAYLYTQKNIRILKADRSTFLSREKLAHFVALSDVIVHLAGMNRGEEKTIVETNIKLVNDLISAFKHTKKKPHVIFSSSTHIYRDTAYGNSKRECSRLLKEWSEGSYGSFTNLILPNVFGESGKPFYNSVLSTFCHQIATGEEPKIIDDSEMKQIHAQEVAREISDIIHSSLTGDVTLSGTNITVTELLHKLKNFDDLYQQHTIPDLTNKFDLQLFNTYRSYLYPHRYPVQVILHKDKRGTLFEAVKSLNRGQTFISTTKPGILRGNHFHTSKFERFFVLSGQAEIRIRKLFTNEVKTFKVSGLNPQYIDIPTLHTHAITNTGNKDLITLFWSHEIFNPDHPDTYPEPIM